MCRIVVFLVVAALVTPTPAQSSMPPPRIRVVQPPGGRAGDAVNRSVVGHDQDEVEVRRFNFPGAKEEILDTKKVAEPAPRKRGTATANVSCDSSGIDSKRAVVLQLDTSDGKRLGFQRNDQNNDAVLQATRPDDDDYLERIFSFSHTRVLRGQTQPVGVKPPPSIPADAPEARLHVRAATTAVAGNSDVIVRVSARFNDRPIVHEIIIPATITK